jgi:hypothetical protein
MEQNKILAVVWQKRTEKINTFENRGTEEG